MFEQIPTPESSVVLREENADEHEARARANGTWDLLVEIKKLRQAYEKLDVSPELVIPAAEYISEQDKYKRMWQHEQYRAVAPGESIAQTFLQIAKPAHDSEVIDFGAGTGRGALNLALFGGLKVRMLDFADNCLDEDIRNATVSQPERIQFTQHDLTTPVPFTAEYGFCTDVMEHIPPADVDKVLTNVLRAAQHVFFQISCVDDVCGALIGHPLHLSVHPFAWWLQKLQALDAVVHWSKDLGDACLFYVSAWQDATEIVKHGALNTSVEEVLANVKANLEGPWKDVTPHQTNDMEVMILGGGPTLCYQLDKIKELRANGVKLITLNGTYNWAVEHGLAPSATVVVDAREFNKRFTKPVVDGCKYLISSQCNPAVLEGLPADRTLLWHGSWDKLEPVISEKREVYYKIPGGSTVMLRAIPLLVLLGFRKFHLFGFDSCVEGGDGVVKHHAYAQPENESEQLIPVNAAGRTFQCHGWMISQAQEFMDLVKFLGHIIDVAIYGDGLINHIVTTGANLATEEDFTLV